MFLRGCSFCVFCAFLWLSFAANSASAKYSGGSGTADDPYRIGTADDLLALGADTNDYDANFILIADIDLASYTFTAAVIAPDINNYVDGFQGTPFTGIFDGACHKISNLTISVTGSSYIGYLGLFGYIEGPVPDYPDYNYKDVVKNLTIEDVNIICSSNPYSTFNTGGLVGYNFFGGVSNCVATGTITGQERVSALGGLVGYNESGSVSNCSSMVTISGNLGVAGMGGLIGYSYYGSITHCSAAGNVRGLNLAGRTAYTTGLGGLVGIQEGGSITDSWAEANVVASGDTTGATASSFGGLVGYNDGGSISQCYATGDVNSDYGCVGGLVGQNYYYPTTSIISNCYATGNVSGDGSVGGLAGGNDGTISNCYSIGTVIGEDHFGGLVGSSDYGTVTDSFWDINTSGLTGSDGGTGKTTTEMKTESTFTDAGWDFVGETINGTEDIWWILEHITYPKLNWQRIIPPIPGGPGDPGSGDGGIYFPDYNFDNFINFLDFAIFANAWLTENPFISLDEDSDVDINDLKIFCDYWLTYTD